VRLPHPPLLVITDRRQARAPLEEILVAAFAAGCRWASIREKDLPVSEQVALARGLLPLARQHGATLTLHGDPVVAANAGLDGVHLPAGDDAKGARALLGQGALIGISIHTAHEAAALAADIVDYATAGPAYDTLSKPGYGPVLGGAGVQAICRSTALPVIAIGGVTASAMAAMIRAGAAGVAVMGSIMRAADPGDLIRRLLAVLGERQSPST
jgi:thiamine-phosphate pyrophosphorylase